MGSPKALLSLRDRPFLTTLVQAFERGGCDPIIVVAGPEGDEDAREIARLARSLGARVAVNQNRNSEQIESLRTALRALPHGVAGVLVSPVDSPGAEPSLVAYLLGAASDAPIVIPTYDGRRGHPILFRRALFDELLDDDLAEGARTVIRRHEATLVEMPVDDGAVLLDVDTPEDYRRLREEHV